MTNLYNFTISLFSPKNIQYISQKTKLQLNIGTDRWTVTSLPLNKERSDVSCTQFRNNGSRSVPTESNVTIYIRNTVPRKMSETPGLGYVVIIFVVIHQQ